MLESQQPPNPFQVEGEINRIMKMLRDQEQKKKMLRERLQFPNLLPRSNAPAGEEIWDAPGFGPGAPRPDPRRQGMPLGGLRELTARAGIV